MLLDCVWLNSGKWWNIIVFLDYFVSYWNVVIQQCSDNGPVWFTQVIDPIVPRYTALLQSDVVPVNIKGAGVGVKKVPVHPKVCAA